jgi:hypothetical protein
MKKIPQKTKYSDMEKTLIFLAKTHDKNMQNSKKRFDKKPPKA